MNTLVAQEGLKIDWANMPTYNTIMAVAVGAALIGLVMLGRQLLTSPEEVEADGWALTFGVLGGILTATGLHMTLTWPLAAGGFPFDNIIFGETSLGFGVLLLGAALYLWKRGAAALASSKPVEKLARVAQPITVFVGGLGLSLVAIAVAGIKYKLFAAPAEEPISGQFADYPMVEATFMSLLIAVVGLGALAFAVLVNRLRSTGTAGVWARITGWLWTVSGVLLLLFGAMNFFTHIGLIVNTM
ncbi:DUF981 family protein [Pimelobacter simplex]|uniref:Uncharacterized protein n=2 Tax=Nocardioides simplex TaxID=2045 RepID=A0A0A1DGV3_NOCSI|nr:DUF981 family protein [Pimelobacter simplex]AIY16494.1 hypothetical protein KR76_06430 [Pimelobacter simplex]MCG8154342.1 DUF981 family protein [Pimelobacter simplex]GEB11781.1 hypothetical protein NSI01_00960 [Pimelobacter simplex]SFN01593.1 Protein of unknown function [Pimelobacter simplex]